MVFFTFFFFWLVGRSVGRMRLRLWVIITSFGFLVFGFLAFCENVCYG